MPASREQLIKEAQNLYKQDLIKEAQAIHYEEREKPLSFADNALDAGLAVGGRVLDGVGWIGEKVDRVTGAPTRSAMMAGLKGENPLSAFGNQFGRPAEKAPRGSDISRYLGGSDKPYFDMVPNSSDIVSKTLREAGFKIEEPVHREGLAPNDVYGFGVDALTDWTNLITPKEAIKSGVKGVGKLFGYAKAGAAKVADYGTGTKAFSTTNKMVDQATTATLNGMKGFFNPTISPKWTRMEQVATRNGIPVETLPDSVKWGPSSSLGRGERALAMQPGGDAEILKINSSHTLVNQKVEEKIREIGKGRPVDKVSGGLAIREGYQKAVNDLFNQTDLTYSTIAQQTPDLPIDPVQQAKLKKHLEDIAEIADYKSKLGVLPAQRLKANQALAAVDAVEYAMEPKLGMGPKQIAKVKESLGNMAQKVKALSQSEFGNPVYRTFLEKYEAEIKALNQNIGKNGRMTSEQLEKTKNILQNIREIGGGLGRKALGGAENKQLKKLEKAFTSASGNQASFKDMVLALKNVGEAAFDEDFIIGQVPADVKKLRDIYFKVSDALKETVKTHLGEDIYNSLLENNQKMSAFFDQTSPIVSHIQNTNLANEELFKSLIMHGNTTEIKAMVETLPQDQLNQVKGAYLYNLVEADKDGNRGFRHLYNALNKNDHILKILYNPKEITDIKELLELGDEIGPYISHLHATGESVQFDDLKNRLFNGVYNRSVLGGLKERATNGPPPVTTRGLKDIIKTPRTPIERALKAAQSVHNSL